MEIVAPGSTIGILGGGQLGRMTAMAARTLGYHVHVLDPDAGCAAGAVADRVVAARFDDALAAAELARHCDVVTLEIEHIGAAALAAAASHAPLRPGAAILEVVQDRAVQKRWLVEHGFPVGAYREVSNAEDLAAAARAMGALFVKTCRGGYDGRSQARVATAAEAPGAWTALGERRSVAEQALDLAAELSVMVARRPSGEVRVYPPALNFHERQILAWSVLPAPLSNTVASRAEEIARGIATAFELEGILAVELFLLGDDSLLVNELAPRPHNSFHETEVACSTSQFEQLVRAVCDLPLGETRALRPGAIYNLFGDLWLRGDGAPRFEAALSRPGVRLHLYGKPGARAGRKMGHLSAIGDTADDALARVRDAAATLTESFT
ncbi:MAG TPA: 5-(carboxyamino)imidazole ribonucleotide synthase [Gemmatimonadaceae bacterium]|nr:5-(carboxyamino)imidazole ribonucleotide synthase [Gemmatimonadaceae bacterium]